MALISDRVKEFKFGLMAQCMRVGGEITRPMEKEGSSMLMGISMMGFGRMIRPMGMVFIPI